MRKHIDCERPNELGSWPRVLNCPEGSSTKRLIDDQEDTCSVYWQYFFHIISCQVDPWNSMELNEPPAIETWILNYVPISSFTYVHIWRFLLFDTCFENTTISQILCWNFFWINKKNRVYIIVCTLQNHSSWSSCLLSDSHLLSYSILLPTGAIFYSTAPYHQMSTWFLCQLRQGHTWETCGLNYAYIFIT